MGVSQPWPQYLPRRWISRNRTVVLKYTFSNAVEHHPVVVDVKPYMCFIIVCRTDAISRHSENVQVAANISMDGMDVLRRYHLFVSLDGRGTKDGR